MWKMVNKVDQDRIGNIMLLIVLHIATSLVGLVACNEHNNIIDNKQPALYKFNTFERE